MTGWIRRHPYTLLAAFIFAAVVGWCAYHPRPWWQYAAVPLYGAAYGFANAPRRRSARRDPASWHPPGPSLPCPPGCHIRVAHRHDPVESFR